MSNSPPNRCGYTWPEDNEINAFPNQASCCWREKVSDEHDRCVWHVDSNGVGKSARELRSARAPPDTRQQNSPYAELLDGANLAGIELPGKISFENVALRDSNLSDAILEDAYLSGADLGRADLQGAELQRADLSDVNLRTADLSDAILREADLSGAALWSADLPVADIRDADLSDADFRTADLSDAVLWEADISGANLWSADLSDADLKRADLRGANLWRADLSGANLRGTTLTGVTLRETTIKDVSMDGATNCHSLDEGYENHRLITTPFIRQLVSTHPRWWPSVGRSSLNAFEWDGTARAYHGLKSAFKDNGLVSKARKQHLRERGARRCEALTAGEWARWVRSWVAWQLTGYGVSIRRLLRNMGIVFGISTLAYLLLEFTRPGHAVSERYATLPEILYYSVITFTTTPPIMPNSTGIKAIVMTEAFFGTLLVVFLGYVLGTREQF